MDTSTKQQAEPLRLVWPAAEYLPGYVAALERGWSPDNRRAAAAQEQLQQVRADAGAFLRSLVDLKAEGGPITLPDGSKAPRLPGYYRWLWDGEFCGSIGLRWQPGSEELPVYCLGHIGYSVVPWKRERGYATRALALMLPAAREQGLSQAQITTDVRNLASQKVILANGGVLRERFSMGGAHGNVDGLRYVVRLQGAA